MGTDSRTRSCIYGFLGGVIVGALLVLTHSRVTTNVIVTTSQSRADANTQPTSPQSPAAADVPVTSSPSAKAANILVTSFTKSNEGEPLPVTIKDRQQVIVVLSWSHNTSRIAYGGVWVVTAYCGEYMLYNYCHTRAT